MISPSKSTQVIEPKARSIIFGHRGGWVFTPSDLARLGDPRSVGMALTRLSRKGIIRQLARGLYDYPIDHPSFGRIPPSADAVAKALAKRDAARLQPTGAYAANILGLSEQVPTRIVFLTDGGEGEQYTDTPGFCKSASTAEIATHGYVLTPGRYVGAEAIEDDGEPFEEKMPRLVAELQTQFAESEKLSHTIRDNLTKLGFR